MVNIFDALSEIPNSTRAHFFVKLLNLKTKITFKIYLINDIQSISMKSINKY